MRTGSVCAHPFETAFAVTALNCKSALSKDPCDVRWINGLAADRRRDPRRFTRLPGCAQIPLFPDCGAPGARPPADRC
jgi:hypothetical protein